MRPIIMTSHSISRSLSYNENKIRLGKVACISTANFLKDTSRQTPEYRLHCFQRRMELNDQVKTNQHITLNFDPTDQLSDERMKQIADFYMKSIGFGQQPYVVYRHFDAGHPHCHIVTTHIQKDGSPIDLYNIGKNQSEEARQKIEARFELVTAGKKNQEVTQQQKSDFPKPVQYGEKGTTRSVAEVVQHVMENYKYTSLNEFNTALRLYRVEADPGKEGSRLHQNHGLLYRVLDEEGKYIGVPLKASYFDFKPTLNNLEQKFQQNLPLKEKSQLQTTADIRWPLYINPDDLDEARKQMEKSKIQMILKKDKSGNCKEVSYIDYREMTIYSGKELGHSGDETKIQEIMKRQKALEQQPKPEQTERQHLRLRM